MHLNCQPLTNSTHPHPSHAHLALYGYSLNALPAGTHFTCFTSTKVRILCAPAPLTRAPHSLRLRAKRSPCHRCRRPIYLLYWYKSTNTDAEGGACASRAMAAPSAAAETKKLPAGKGEGGGGSRSGGAGGGQSDVEWLVGIRAEVD
jgi:hypothetical protein